MLVNFAGTRFTLLVNGQVHIPSGGWSEAWNEMPQADDNVQITPDKHDYFGNFNAEIFECLFENLCKALQKYGPCHIHMGSAKYHVRCLNLKPTENAIRKQILEWHDANNYKVQEAVKKTSRKCHED